ncbi:TetR/AcrR family transcriptional regulator [Nocardia sp. NPDC005366]|uniref:TetR/AcrR family transcriptional regulator n=1 Tax=Nocardia sp. NPDC005366 TaxID=3156878 RepID=UPI0033B42737
MTTSQTRGGRTAEMRRAARRQQLIDAAIDIWADGGWAAVSLRSVCARARLNDRYFRESFSDRDALLAAVWDQVRDETTATLVTAIDGLRDSEPLVVFRRAVEAVVTGFAADPRRTQVLFGDHAGSEILERRRRDLILVATDVLATGMAPYLRNGLPRNEFYRTVLMAVGGFVELTTAWRAGAIAIDVDEIISQTIHFGEILVGHYLAADPQSGQREQRDGDRAANRTPVQLPGSTSSD